MVIVTTMANRKSTRIAVSLIFIVDTGGKVCVVEVVPVSDLTVLVILRRRVVNYEDVRIVYIVLMKAGEKMKRFHLSRFRCK